jgi:hypothetical protein
MSQILYNEDQLEDVINVLAFIDKFTSGLGVNGIEIDTRIIEGVVKSCKLDFPCKDGIEKASAFKKVANFICFFIAERPIIEPFPKEIIGENLAKIENHQNAIVAFELAKMVLHGAHITREDGEFNVKHEIKVSAHSYIDIIESLASITPSLHFKMVAVLLEQLVYKSNPDCQYDIE